MEYITSGDRIAVENFEIGSLYKVTFLNETEVYFMCCGIGKDFVMLMSNEPRLFSLTMLSAAEVDAIDEYTPLPPPPTNLLQYQTGEPPFTFTTTDTELFSWYIKGPAGDKTANLLYLYKAGYRYDNSATEIQAASANIYAFDVDSGNTYTINAVYNTSVGASTLRIFGFKQGVATTTITISNVSDLPYTYTVSSDIDEIRLSLSTGATSVMANTGSTALPYEPYGYKIPISCNTTISNIYIEEPLGENDILYSTDTTYTIATELGDNLLQVQGETQPSRMQIVYKWEFEG